MVGVSKTQMSDYVRLRNLPSIERTYNIAMMLGCAPEEARVYEKGGEGIAEQVKGGAEQVSQK